MTFCKIQSVRGIKGKKNEWELIRYASKGSVVGGASRLFTAFVRDYNPKRIVSYSQNDWFDGSIYECLEFKLSKELGSDYRTLWDGELRHKSYTRRSNLSRLLGSSFDPDLSEHQNLLDNDIPILYDSGKKKWEWKRKRKA